MGDGREDSADQPSLDNREVRNNACHEFTRVRSIFNPEDPGCFRRLHTRLSALCFRSKYRGGCSVSHERACDRESCQMTLVSWVVQSSMGFIALIDRPAPTASNQQRGGHVAARRFGGPYPPPSILPLPPSRVPARGTTSHRLAGSAGRRAFDSKTYRIRDLPRRCCCAAARCCRRARGCRARLLELSPRRRSTHGRSSPKTRRLIR